MGGDVQYAEAQAVHDAVVRAGDSSDLPQVLHTAPAAVALIDLTEGLVTYANDSARELTGGRADLPVDVDAWSEAAGLTDLSGRPMRDTAPDTYAQRLARLQELRHEVRVTVPSIGSSR